MIKTLGLALARLSILFAMAGLAAGQTTTTTTRYVLPHIAVGGDDWTTTITLVGPQPGVSGPESWALRFWSPNGQPYYPTINGQLMTSGSLLRAVGTRG